MVGVKRVLARGSRRPRPPRPRGRRGLDENARQCRSVRRRAPVILKKEFEHDGSSALGATGGATGLGEPARRDAGPAQRPPRQIRSRPSWKDRGSGGDDSGTSRRAGHQLEIESATWPLAPRAVPRQCSTSAPAPNVRHHSPRGQSGAHEKLCRHGDCQRVPGRSQVRGRGRDGVVLRCPIPRSPSRRSSGRRGSRLDVRWQRGQFADRSWVIGTDSEVQRMSTRRSAHQVAPARSEAAYCTLPPHSSIWAGWHRWGSSIDSSHRADDVAAREFSTSWIGNCFPRCPSSVVRPCPQA